LPISKSCTLSSIKRSHPYSCTSSNATYTNRWQGAKDEGRRTQEAGQVCMLMLRIRYIFSCCKTRLAALSNICAEPKTGTQMCNQHAICLRQTHRYKRSRQIDIYIYILYMRIPQMRHSANKNLGQKGETCIK